MVLVIVDGDDWSGIYLNNRLVFEDHAIPPEVALDIAINNGVKTFTKVFCDLEWIANRGSLPENFSDVVISNE